MSGIVGSNGLQYPGNFPKLQHCHFIVIGNMDLH